MLQELLTAVDALSLALVDFDPNELGGSQCVTVVEALAGIEKRCAAARIRAAARAAECRAPAAKGFPDPAEWLARQSGTTTGEARAALRTAANLDNCPETRDALAAGELSLDQAGEIVRTEAECPGSEERLLGLARTTGMAGLKDAARKTRLDAQDPSELHRRQRAARYLRMWQDDLGMTRVNGAFAPEDGVALLNRIDVRTDRLWRAAHHRGRPEPRERLAADALIQLTTTRPRTGPTGNATSSGTESTDAGTHPGPTATSPTAGSPASADGGPTRSGQYGDTTTGDPSAGTDGPFVTGGPDEVDGRLFDDGDDGDDRDGDDGEGVSQSPGRRAELVIVCDLAAYRRGQIRPGETCHIIGGGPIPVDLARQIAQQDPFLKAVLHYGTRIDTVAHFGRHIPAHLLTALTLGNPPQFQGAVCDHPGCDRRHHLEWDHTNPVANGGPTSYQNLRPRCGPHHDQKTEQDRAAGLLHHPPPKP